MNLARGLIVIVLAVVGLVLAGCNGANDKALDLTLSAQGTGRVTKVYTNAAGSWTYSVLVPHNYTPKQKWPTIMFLHGIGEAGRDGKAPLRVGLAPFVAEKIDNFPFLVVVPQSSGGWDEDSADADAAMAILDQVQRDYTVDPDRISLTGLSTGGYGTCAIGAKYQDRFACLVPMGMSGNASKWGPVLAKMNVWILDNGGDFLVMPGSTGGTISAIRAAGGDPKHTVYGAIGHNCWERAYSDGELFDWMLQQRRAAAPTNGNGNAPRTQAPAATPARAAKSAPAAPAQTGAVTAGATKGQVDPRLMPVY